MGLILAFVVDAGPVFLPFRFTPWQQKASLLTSPKTYKSTFVLQLLKGYFPDTFRNCKPFTREHRFRLLGHIPHALVDDGALFPFSLSETEPTSVH